MKYKVTLNGRTYEVEVEHGKAMLLDEYEAIAPAPVAAAPLLPLWPLPPLLLPQPLPPSPVPVRLSPLPCPATS